MALDHSYESRDFDLKSCTGSNAAPGARKGGLLLICTQKPCLNPETPCAESLLEVICTPHE